MPVNFERVGTGKPRGTVQRLDTVSGQTFLHLIWNWIGKSALVGHQIRPVNLQPVRIDPFAAHKPRGIDDFSATPQDFLGITAPQGACPAVGQCIHNSYTPACCSTFIGGCNAGHARADDDQIVFI